MMYISRKLIPREKNDSIMEKDCLAVKWACSPGLDGQRKGHKRSGHKVVLFPSTLLFFCSGQVRGKALERGCPIEKGDVHHHSKDWGHLEMSLFLKEKHLFCPLK